MTDPESIRASAPMLRALANNRTFLAEAIARELRDWRAFQLTNGYYSESLVLGGGDGFFLRANTWRPAAATLAVDPAAEWALGARRVASFYELVHNHAFSFLTVGYYGPGYETDLYTVADAGLAARVGDPAALTFVERTGLPVGKVMYYAQQRDVHRQWPPQALSISLNLMIVPPPGHWVEQRYFDLNTGTVAAVVNANDTARALLCDVAGALGSGASAAHLEAIAAAHPSERVRDAARGAFGRIRGRAPQKG